MGDRARPRTSRAGDHRSRPTVVARTHSRCVNSISVCRLAGNSGLTESVHADQIQATCSQSQEKFHAASVYSTGKQDQMSLC